MFALTRITAAKSFKSRQTVSGGDLQNALGNHLQQAAQSVGLNVGDAGNVLLQYLPQIINAITPNGTAADGFGLDDVLRIAQQFLKYSELNLD